MILFKGGLSKVEYDDSVNFSSATEIPEAMKTTKIEFSTPTEEKRGEQECRCREGCEIHHRI